MATVVEIPLIPNTAQRLRVTLNGITYTFDLRWNSVAGCWILDILSADATVAILRGIPLVTGLDLLGQYHYTQIGGVGALVVLTFGVGNSVSDVPTFGALGVESHLYFSMRDAA